MCVYACAPAAAAMEGLAGRFSAAMAITPSGGPEQHGPSGGGASPGPATPLGLERNGSSDDGAIGRQPNPFAAASKLISGLRKSSPSGAQAESAGELCFWQSHRGLCLAAGFMPRWQPPSNHPDPASAS